MTMTFTEKVAALKAKINDRLTKDSPKELLDFTKSVNEELESLQADYETLKAEKTEIQDMYVKSIKTSGSTEKPKEEEADKKPRTLEEIGAEIIKSDNGGK